MAVRSALSAPALRWSVLTVAASPLPPVTPPSLNCSTATYAHSFPLIAKSVAHRQPSEVCILRCGECGAAYTCRTLALIRAMDK